MGKRKKVEKVFRQAKEPLSLLNTLKEEGLSRAAQLAAFAGAAAKSVNADMVKDQVRDSLGQLGFATRAEVQRLQERIVELEERLDALEGNGRSEEE